MDNDKPIVTHEDTMDEMIKSIQSDYSSLVYSLSQNNSAKKIAGENDTQDL